jgi:hypothetical protein
LPLYSTCVLGCDSAASDMNVMLFSHQNQMPFTLSFLCNSTIQIFYAFIIVVLLMVFALKALFTSLKFCLVIQDF